MLGRARPFPFIAAALAVIVLAGCVSASARRGDRLLAAGDYDGAVEAYRAALIEHPNDGRVLAALEAAERRAAAARVDRGDQRAAAGDLPGAVEMYDEAVRLDPQNPAARAGAQRERPKLEAARRAIATGKARLAAGDPIEAERALAPVIPYRAGFPELDELYHGARRASAAAHRDRAAKLLADGEIARANAELDEAKRLESSPLGAAPPPAGAGPGDQTAGPAPLVGAPALDAYARAAAQVQRLTAGLPRSRGPGLARPEDYALPEDRIPELRAAIARALETRPSGERQPAWLAHGRLVLQMSLETAATGHVNAARSDLAAGAVVEAYREIERAHALDRESTILPQFQDTVGAVRMAMAKALLVAADRAEADGLHHLAKLRARQAAEIDPAAGGAAAEVVARAEARGGAPQVAVLPFQNYSGRPGLDERLYARILHRLERDGAAGVLPFDLYRKRKEAGLLPPVAAIVRGEIRRAEVGVRGDPEAEIRARIDALTEKARAARRRVLAAPTPEERAIAAAEADDADRLVARAERERAASLFAAGGDRRKGPRPEEPVTFSVEVRFQLYDPRAGRDVFGEPIIRAVDGRARDIETLEGEALDRAAEPIAAAIEERLRASAEAALDRAPLDPRAALDARIAELERGGAAASKTTADVVLEATGYSFAEKRTVPERLRID
jgi:tetratricopeptide (TPR) repeat protein